MLLWGFDSFSDYWSKHIVKAEKKKQGNRYWNFSSTWYKAFPWLSLCITKKKAFCCYCRYCSNNKLLGMLKKGEETFVTNGFDNWKKACKKFHQHSLSDLHKEAVLKIELMNQQDNVFTLIQKNLASDQQSHPEMLLRQISSLKFLLKQGLAIRGREKLEGNLLQLLKLRSEDFPYLKGGLKRGNIFLLQF